jgi:hypothetical protein
MLEPTRHVATNLLPQRSSVAELVACLLGAHRAQVHFLKVVDLAVCLSFFGRGLLGLFFFFGLANEFQHPKDQLNPFIVENTYRWQDQICNLSQISSSAMALKAITLILV